MSMIAIPLAVDMEKVLYVFASNNQSRQNGPSIRT